MKRRMTRTKKRERIISSGWVAVSQQLKIFGGHRSSSVVRDTPAWLHTRTYGHVRRQRTAPRRT